MPRFLALLLVATTIAAFAIPTQAAPHISSSSIQLRRATFDPLQRTPAVRADMQASNATTLRLVQFDTPPDQARRDTLAAQGITTLMYIPDNALLVRGTAPDLAGIKGLRWQGPFLPQYKLSSDLDGVFGSDTLFSAQIVVAADQQPAGLAAAISAGGGSLDQVVVGLNNPVAIAQISGSLVRTLVQHDDVLWIEPYEVPRLSNDRALGVMGVPEARQTYPWLTGKGQIIAIADSGLDVQSSVTSGGNADFAAQRIVAGFAPSQLSASCTRTDWNDLQGHGTHVAGSAFGSGARSPAGHSFGGVAPEAGMVIQTLSQGAGDLNCGLFDNAFLQKGYDAGARIQNASWGTTSTKGAYTSLSANIDTFLWQHKDMIFVTVAGNTGVDANANGVVDADSIIAPGTGKNVITVGASENNRPPSKATCVSSGTQDENACWTTNNAFIYAAEPIKSDFVANNINGMAPFSSRGPTDDGRIKPDIVAPGVLIISAASHAENITYTKPYNSDYVYNTGTSMAAPMVTGMAALVRQWLVTAQARPNPSAALVKVLLLNGAVSMGAGQYGTGAAREIPAQWPNTVAGWGRANLSGAIGQDGASMWFADEQTGAETNGVVEYALQVPSGASDMKIALAWTDYPAEPLVQKTLVNDLDLEVVAPDGTVIQGNQDAQLPTTCRSDGADRCNTVESIGLAVADAGTYTVRVRGHAVVNGPQPFAVAARWKSNTVPGMIATFTANAEEYGKVALQWSPVSDTAYYQLEASTDSTFAKATPTIVYGTNTSLWEYGQLMYYRVRACNAAGCGPYTSIQQVQTTERFRLMFPLVGHN